MSSRQTIAAFFDLDGTLLPAPSLEWRFVSYLLSGNKLGASNIARWLLHVAPPFLRGARRAIEENKFYLAGLPLSLLADWEDSIPLDRSNPEAGLEIFDEGLKRIAWHQSRGHSVFLISGTLAPLARVVAGVLPGKVVAVATELKILGNAHCADQRSANGADDSVRVFPINQNSAIWTGELAGAHMVGEAKRRVLRTLAARHHLDLASSYAYGDSIADCAMLESVGHPEVVNPSRPMAFVARKRGWPVSRWNLTAVTQDKKLSLGDSAAELPGPRQRDRHGDGRLVRVLQHPAKSLKEQIEVAENYGHAKSFRFLEYR
jgi:phosphoserine phosphatase